MNKRSCEMRKIYVDISTLLTTVHTSGIQRVVRKVVHEMIGLVPDRLVLLSYDITGRTFYSVPFADFLSWESGILTREKLVQKKQDWHNVSIAEVTGNVFLDLDAVWVSLPPRHVLYRELKLNDVLVVTFLHDLLPVSLPQYTSDNDLICWQYYLGAVLKYADAVITSTKTVMEELEDLCHNLEIACPRIFYSWLGADFIADEKEKHPVNDKLKLLAGGMFILSVGTLEPRKNHMLLLDAFEESLYGKNLRLVLVGVMGWKSDAIRMRIVNDSHLEKELFCLQGLSDADLLWLYRNAFLFAFPSYGEGFGLPIVEALQNGLPVLASDLPVLREVGRDYCEYFKTGDEKDFIDKVIAMLEVKERYLASVKHVKEFPICSWRESAKRIVDSVDFLKT